MTRKILAGVVGLGRQGQRHLAALNQISGLRVAAVCDADPAIVENTLQQFPNASGYTLFADLLSAQQLDILCIATTAPSHAELTAAAATAGIPRLLCEKPMATSMSEADAMIDICHKHGTRFSINHCRRWSATYRSLFEQLKTGVLGQVRHIMFTCGGGRLGSNGGHAFDMMRYLAQAEVVEVSGCLDAHTSPDPRGPQFSDPGGFGQIHFANGCRASLDLSSDLGVPPLWDIVCTDGRIQIDEIASSCVIASRAAEYQDKPSHARYGIPLDSVEKTIDPLDIVELTQTAIMELLSSSPSSCSGEDGRAALELSVAFHLSHQAGHKAITLPLSGKERDFQLEIA